MSIETHRAADVALRTAGLSRTARECWSIMDQHADANGKVECLTFRRLVTLLGYGKRAAWRAQEELQRAGLIRRVRQGKRGLGPAVFQVSAPMRTEN